MLTIKGKLPVGVEFEGQLHRDFELREQLVKDMVEVADDKDLLESAEKNDSFLGICIMAKRLVSLGNIPADEVTPDLLMTMLQEDFNALSVAAYDLTEQRRIFRDAARAAAENTDGAGEAGV